MAHPSVFAGLFALALPLAAPAAAQAPQGAPAHPHYSRSTIADARIDVLKGRVVVVGGGHDAELVRRGHKVDTTGAAQIEISAGSQARIGWTGTMSIDVWGPTSFQWTPVSHDRISLRFHEVAWVDMEVRRGEHAIELPSDWHCQASRTSLHLRGLGGGPTEIRCNAGEPLMLEWQGSENELRPPFAVYPGSSVRLDRPRHHRRETAQTLSTKRPWTTETGRADRDPWPYRTYADTPAQVAERRELRRETQKVQGVPGTEASPVSKMRTFAPDGSSTVREIQRNETHAQVPVEPGRPQIRIEPRRPAVELPPRAETAPVRRSSPQEVTRQATRRSSVHFDPKQWRDLERSSLNGTGAIAAERASGAELRVLGSGRVKVMVSATSPSPRWCFSPTNDYLIQPGAIAVFEKDGSLSMTLGDVEERNPIAGRPSFSALAGN